jgi:hypothetical protein
MSTLYAGNHVELKQIVKRIYKTQLPLFIHGTFGIGKTVSVREAAMEMAKELGLEFSDKHGDINNPKKFCFIPLILHHYDAGEIKGIPFPNAERTHTVYLPIGLLPEKGQGYIFLDEMNLAAPMMQNNGYQLIEDRRLGDYVVPEGYICIGAGNLTDDRGNTYDMPMPLNNRFLHFHLMPPVVEDWVNNYAIPHNLDHRIMNYLQYAQSELYAFKPDSTIDQIAVGTPRMWEKVSRLIKDIPTEEEENLQMFTSLGVGTATAGDFVAWLKLSKKYDIAGMFKGSNFDLPKDGDVGMLYSLTSALVGFYTTKVNALKNKAVDSAEAKAVNKMAVTLLKIAAQFRKEHTVLIMTQAKLGDPLLHPRIKAEDKELYTKFSTSIFAFLI